MEREMNRKNQKRIYKIRRGRRNRDDTNRSMMTMVAPKFCGWTYFLISWELV